ncbi:MAG: hypothetical protein SLAVMIC_00291 [uncultured marine phage]|uniref:Uncharacterized protein n=1 Tax=uncultured marine phage TaxID=707152 RepID=A0A8D9CEX4_9VIRU|nr:MAG: hypothetical protein SLAVMIC_00291 [uncultured marine phage]
MKYLKTFESMREGGRSVETIGAKIRNRLSPYNMLITLIEDEDIPNEEAFKFLEKKIELHKKCLDELEALSHECEIEPSDKWDRYGD